MNIYLQIKLIVLCLVFFFFITYFVSEKINSKKKVQWIHFDVSKISFNKIFANKFYKKFDKVFVVSKEGKVKLTTFIPSLSNKIDVFTNILPKT